MASREPTKRDILAHILSNRAWIIPILYHIYSLGGARISELRETIGLKTMVLKRAIWWLTKYGLIEKSGEEKYVLSKDYRRVIGELFMTMCRTGKYYIIRYGATYIVINVKKTRISSYTVPGKLVEELIKLEEQVGSSFTHIDLANSLNIPPKLAYRVVKLRNLLKECRK